MKSAYAVPEIVELGRFRSVTNGVWFGRWRDLFGGKAFVKVEVG